MLAAPFPAHAAQAPSAAGAPADPADEVASLERAANDFAASIATPGSGDASLWKKKLDEAATLLLLDQYEEASYRYFVLASDPAAARRPERREALFYLGESLFLLGDYRAAKPFYTELAAGGRDESFQPEANVRLIEIASATGDDEMLDRAWTRIAASPGMAGGVDPAVAYALGKSWYRRGDYARADQVFMRIDVGVSRGRQARYFRAVIALRRGDPERAEQIFSELVQLPAEGKEQTAIRDRARLSLARLRYARGAWDDAIGTYALVPEDSPQRPAALYEKAWAELKSARAREAADDLDLFLIAFPDDPLAPKVKLLRARLDLAMGRDDESREGFKGFTAEYQPVMDKVDEILHANDDAAGLLARLNAREGARGISRALPLAAAQTALADAGMRRAVALVQEVDQEEGSVADARALSLLVQDGLQDATLSGLPDANARRRLAWSLDLRAQRSRLAILERAAAGLATGAPVAGLGNDAARRSGWDAARARVQAALEAVPAAEAKAREEEQTERARISILRAEIYHTRDAVDQARATATAVGKYLHDSALDPARDPILGRASPASVTREMAELDARDREISRLLRELKDREAATRAAVLAPPERAARAELDAALTDLQARLPGPLPPEQAAQLDRVTHARLRIAAALDGVAKDEKARIADAGAKLAAENADVDADAKALADVHQRTVAESGEAARRGLLSVRSTLDGLLLRADLGLLDVSWTEKERETKARENLEAEQKTALDAVDRKFRPLLSHPPEDDAP